MTTRKRQPKGIPIGGEFASMSRGESGIDLADVASATEAIKESKRLIREYDKQRFEALFSEMMSNMPESACSVILGCDEVQIELTEDSTEIYSRDAGGSIGRVSYHKNGNVASIKDRRGEKTLLNKEDSIAAAKAVEQFVVGVNRTAADMVKNLGADVQYEDVPNFGGTMESWYAVSIYDKYGLLRGSDEEEQELTDEEVLRFARTYGGGWGSNLDIRDLNN